jgi:hypothetical protein
VLAFETRLEALREGVKSQEASPYHERHVRSALERHIAETLLASLPIEPEPTRRELEQQTELAREMLTDSVGGRGALEAAANAEGITAHGLFGVLRRKARASLYLDHMVAPMLNPTESELRALYSSGRSPFRNLPFEQVAEPLARWYVGRRMSDALSRFFQGARSRLTITIVSPHS